MLFVDSFFAPLFTLGCVLSERLLEGNGSTENVNDVLNEDKPRAEGCQRNFYSFVSLDFECKAFLFGLHSSRMVQNWKFHLGHSLLLR